MVLIDQEHAIIGTTCSLVPKLSWNVITYCREPHLHNFNVCVPDRGSLGTRLLFLVVKHSTSLDLRPG